MTYSSIKKRVYFLSIFSLFLTSLSAQVAFQETSLSNAQLIIQEEQLPYILYFYGEWCPACQLMEEMTFKNKKVNKRIEKNYVIFKVNTESVRGQEWMANYNVTSVPTTLFYTKDKILLNRLESTISATDFLKLTEDLGTLTADEKLVNDVNTSIIKDNLQTASLSKKRRINSSPKDELAKEDLKTTITAINLEIESLKVLNEDLSANTLAAKSPASKSKITSKRDILTAKGGRKTPASYPSAQTITTQIDACKALLTGQKNVQRLIHILEDYKLILVSEQEKEASKLMVAPEQNEEKAKLMVGPVQEEETVKLMVASEQDEEKTKLMVRPVQDKEKTKLMVASEQNEETAKLMVASEQDEEKTKLVIEPKQEKETVKQNSISPTVDKASIKKVVHKELTPYQKRYAYNQQIISYLKLALPVETGNQYIVQIGKYQQIRNAERLVQKIQDKYDYPVKILIQKQEDTPIQIVYLGEFETKAEAIAANENLKWIGRKGMVKQF